ncbi:fibropellin-1-like [Physella acuta]|uniref:fibropellin-1-like n=1 Tax=Physella acuta TaxID=109671 RepID=UPI0027DE72BE|nr:fibropellin-1-like [Physella acuta]
MQLSIRSSIGSQRMYILQLILVICQIVITQANHNRHEPCHHFHCHHGGRCLAPYDDPYCVCPAPYTGKHCEMTIMGHQHPGRCPTVNSNRYTGAHCKKDGHCKKTRKCCRNKWGNKVCTKPVRLSRDPCLNYICLNGGRCIAPAEVPSCNCPSGFYGPHCEVSRNPCLSFVCLNGGICTAPADVTICHCLPGFSGTYCEVIRDPCLNFQCCNGGYCTAPADVPYCVCPAGYTGVTCETRVTSSNGSCPEVTNSTDAVCSGYVCTHDNDCSTEQKCCPSPCGRSLCTSVNTAIRDPCLNFHCCNCGYCIAPLDVPYCVCPAGYTGVTCQFPT